MKIRSQRIEGFVQSDIRAMTHACNAVGGVNLGQGICDIPAPDIVKQAALEAIRGDRSIYTRYDGDDSLRQAIARKLEHYNRVRYDAENEVVVTIGASGALTATLHALTDPGDEIILFEPYYGYHLNTARIAGLEPRLFPLAPPTFAIDLDRLEAMVTPRTRAILVNTPVNPSGKVFTRVELEGIAAICQRHDLLCITDEIYEYIVYDGREHLSMASLPGMRERTVTISGYSKTFSVTGWRIGYAAAPQELALAIGLVNDLFSICAPSPLQRAVATAIDRLDDSYYAGMAARYHQKRDEFCGVLQQVGLTPIVPDGAYYVLADISRLGADNARDAAHLLLDQSGVAGVPGTAFYTGAAGESLIRFCFAKRQEDLDEACERLLAWGQRT